MKKSNFKNLNCCKTVAIVLTSLVICIAAHAEKPTDISKSPVAFYDFEGENASVLLDKSGNKFNGKIFNGQIVKSGSGKALLLSGKGYAEIPGHPKLLTQTFSISLWIRPEKYTPYNTLISVGAGKKNAYFLWTYKGLSFVIFDYKTGKYNHTRKSKMPQLNEWTHIAISFKQGKQKLYINGKIVKSRDLQQAIVYPEGTNILIGKRSDLNVSSFFIGAIDDIAIYDRILTNSEIMADYKKNKRTDNEIQKPESKHTNNVVPRSDGNALNVDFENYTDGIVPVLNAGVRLMGYSFVKKAGIAYVTKNGKAFSGKRAGYMASLNEKKNKTRIAFVPPYTKKNAVYTDEVGEIVYKMIWDDEKLKDFTTTIWNARSSYHGRITGIKLVAVADKKAGTYNLDILDANGLIKGTAKGLDPGKWIRFILRRYKKSGTVGVWCGEPGKEKFVGEYKDRRPSLKTGLIICESLYKKPASGYIDDIRLGGVLKAGEKMAAPEARLRDMRKEKYVLKYPVKLYKIRQLFVDKKLIEKTENISFEMHPVKKYEGNPIVKATKKWHGHCITFPGSVYRDEKTGMFKMWYNAWSNQAGYKYFLLNCYAESKDGKNWIQPNLGVFELDGNKNNDIVSDMRLHDVTYDPRDPDPNRRYKGSIRYNGFSLMCSKDGFNWDKNTIKPLITQAYDSSNLYWDPVGEKWIMSVKIALTKKWQGNTRIGRARGYAESKDLKNWTDTFFLTACDSKDARKDQMYRMGMFRYQSVYLGMLMMLHGNGTTTTQLAFSRNLKSWDRTFRKPFIDVSKDKWDSGCVAPVDSPPIRVGDQLYFYYSSTKGRHGSGVAAGDRYTGAIGLSTLRVDGFVSANAGKKTGVLVTKPLMLSGNQLYINADVAKDGEIKVEIIEEDISHDVAYRPVPFVPIQPYNELNCNPIKSNKVKISVTWKNAKDLTIIEDGMPVRLRFHLKNAKLYSFWTE